MIQLCLRKTCEASRQRKIQNFYTQTSLFDLTLSSHDIIIMWDHVTWMTCSCGHNVKDHTVSQHSGKIRSGYSKRWISNDNMPIIMLLQQLRIIVKFPLCNTPLFTTHVSMTHIKSTNNVRTKYTFTSYVSWYRTRISTVTENYSF